MAIGTPTAIASNANQASGTTLAITVPAGGVPSGASIFLGIAMDANAGTVSATDSGSNSYTADADNTQGAGTSGVRTVLLSAHNVAALVSTNTITITFPTTVAKAIGGLYITGLATASTLDVTATGGATTDDPASGNLVTTQADEALVGALGVEADSSITFTPVAGWTTRIERGTDAGAKTTNQTIRLVTRVVAATGTYTFNNSTLNALSSAEDWSVAIGTYKGASVVDVTSFVAGAMAGEALSGVMTGVVYR